METSEGRTVGKAPAGGRLRIGQIVSCTNGKASIPSRFETILFSGAREKNAFGRRTNRFDAAEDDLPGPGSYKKPRTLTKNTPSLSKRGTGGFASASKITANQPRALFLTPGPGSYKYPEAPSAQNISASFARPVLKRAIGTRTESSRVGPGPGAYNVAKENVSEKPSSIFESKTKREPLAGRNSNPGPGEYQMVQSGELGIKQESAVFKSSITRVNKVDPKLGALARKLPQAPRSGPEGFTGQNGRPGSPVSPGTASKIFEKSERESPGILTAADEIMNRKNRPKPSSVFATTVLDRFGKPTIRYVPSDFNYPGPGNYDIEPPKKRLLISSSWAMSGTERFSEGLSNSCKPPGPAFYNPSMFPDKVRQSFHLNNKGAWL